MEPQFVVQNFVRFFNYVRISGALFVPGRTIVRLTAIQPNQPIFMGHVNLPSPGTTLTRGFLITFTCEQFEPKDLLLIFDLDNGTKFQITGAQLASYYLENEGNANQAEKRSLSVCKRLVTTASSNRQPGPVWCRAPADV